MSTASYPTLSDAPSSSESVCVSRARNDSARVPCGGLRKKEKREGTTSQYDLQWNIV